MGDNNKKTNLDEKTFELIAEYTYDWEIWIGTGGKLKWTNGACERVLGYTKDELMAMKNFPEPLLPKNEKNRGMQLMKDALMTKKSGNDEIFSVIKKGGTENWIAVSWQSMYDKNKNWMGVRFSMRDVEDRQKEKIELMENQEKLERMNKIMVGREMKMIELKKEINRLKSNED